MGTAVAQAAPIKSSVSLPGRRYDNVFFTGCALLMLVTVLVGFGPTYFFAGMWRAPLPSVTIHVHGALFSAWILLLVTQTSLVSAGRVDIHRKLGIAGFVLACLMIIAGLVAATDAMAHFPRPGRDALAFYIVPVSDIFIFAVLIANAFRTRRDPASHKRLILIATNALLIAAVARWPLALVHRHVVAAGLVSDVFLVILIAYDLFSLHRIHRATLWAGGFFVIVQQIRFPIGQTAAWHSFAGWVQAAFR
jgi:hypothetical protein